MDIAVLRNNFKAYLQKRYPNQKDNSISSTVSMAFFLDCYGSEYDVDFQQILINGIIPVSYKSNLEKHL